MVSTYGTADAIAVDVLRAVLRAPWRRLILVAHDYHLIFRRDPIKGVEDTAPLSADLAFAQEVMNACDFVIFNSHNSFKNFVRWIRVPRPLLIQGVPDILTSPTSSAFRSSRCT